MCPLLTVWGIRFKYIFPKWLSKLLATAATSRFQCRLINKHFSQIWTHATGWPFITSVFPFLCLTTHTHAHTHKSLCYYVKLCLWKHRFAPVLRSPSPGWLGYTSPHSGWETADWSQVCAHVLPDKVSGQNSSAGSQHAAAFRNKCSTVGILKGFSENKDKKSWLEI